MALVTVALITTLALLSKRADAPRMPAPMRRRARDMLRQAAQTAGVVARLGSPAHALSQCERTLGALDALEALCGGDGAQSLTTLNALGGYDVGAMRANLAQLQQGAFDATTTTAPMQQAPPTFRAP